MAERPTLVRRRAPAKINLYLHVTGRRPDGYHLLESLVVFAAVGDEVTAAPDDGLHLSVEGPFAAGLAPSSDNLVLRAARALAAANGREAAARLQLGKHLPVAAGLGGGSADAAATLLALSELWGIAADLSVLDPIALRLGADVPVCLRQTAQLVSGVGERLTPASGLPPCHLVLVNPGIGLPTGEVFAVRRGPYSEPEPWTAAPKTASELAELLHARRNDLEPPAQLLQPAIDQVLRALRSQPGCLLARMSGSGATCFGLFAAAVAAEQAAAAIRTAEPAWWAVATNLI